MDVKDKKILYLLSVNSRQSLNRIGKKVGLSREVVAYRIKRLKEIGVIKSFNTVVDSSKLGYSCLRFYLTYQYVTPEIKEEIVDYFVKCNYTTFVHSGEGVHDLVLILAVKNMHEFYIFWEKTLNKYRDYFANRVFSIYDKAIYYSKGYSFLLDEMTDRTTLLQHNTNEGVELISSGKTAEIDDLDFRILTLIAVDARMPTTEIAEKLDVTALTIKNRIKKLIKLEVITGFNVCIDFQKTGYKLIKVFIVLKDYKKMNQIIDYMKGYPNLDSIDKSLGYVDMQLVFNLKNTSQLHQIMQDISAKFPNVIKNYTYHCAIESHKWRYMPES